MATATKTRKPTLDEIKGLKPKANKKAVTTVSPARPVQTGATPSVSQVTDDERALVAKYGKQCTIKLGSLRYSGGRPGWNTKRTVIVLCRMPTTNGTCGKEVVRATSDLQFPTCAYCESCGRDIRRSRKTTKAAKKATTTKKGAK